MTEEQKRQELQKIYEDTKEMTQPIQIRMSGVGKEIIALKKDIEEYSKKSKKELPTLAKPTSNLTYFTIKEVKAISIDRVWEKKVIELIHLDMDILLILF